MISPQFLTTVAGSAAFFVALVSLVTASAALIYTDVRSRLLPNSIVFGAIAVGAITMTTTAALMGFWTQLLFAGIGCVALFASYLAIALIRPGGMGGGDVKLAALVGMYLGWFGWQVFIVGTVGAFVLAAGHLVWKNSRGRLPERLAFGPYMIAATWAGIAFHGFVS